MSPSSAGPPPLRRMIVPALFVAALFVVVFLRQPGGPDKPDLWVVSGPTMGTAFTVKIVIPPELKTSRSGVETAIRDAVDEVDLAMSTYRPDSELSRFNLGGTEIFKISAALFEVVTEAQRVAELSDGAFDITVGPLVDAWGFGPEPVMNPPGDEQITALLIDNGHQRLRIESSPRAIRKDRAGLRCDLSAIAKGFAVDRVAESLGELGFEDFMVEIGGEVRAAGHNAAGEAWRIGIERPDMERGGIWSAIALVDASMATSGDYRNYHERDGVRISHTIDPRTGRPVTHSLASVTVVHPNCMTADALATALTVLGPEVGRELAEREGLAAFFLIRNEQGGFDEWASSGWNENIDVAVDVGDGES